MSVGPAILHLVEIVRNEKRLTGKNGFVPVLSEPDEDRQGRTGWVHGAVVADLDDLPAYELYMAGPPPRVNAGRGAFRDTGMQDEQMHHDSFEYAGTHATRPTIELADRRRRPGHGSAIRSECSFVSASIFCVPGHRLGTPVCGLFRDMWPRQKTNLVDDFVVDDCRASRARTFQQSVNTLSFKPISR